MYSKSYIMALHSRRLSHLGTGLVDLLLVEYCSMAANPPPNTCTLIRMVPC